MKKSKIFIMLLFVGAIANAQTDSIRGYVNDEKGMPLDYVNVLLGQSSDSSMVQWAVTDAKGYFAMPKNKNGNYIKVSSVGYRTEYVSDISKSPVTVVLKANDMMLGGVTVKAFRPTVKLTKEGFSTNVEGTPIAYAGTAMEVLGQIPMVQSMGDEIQVFGKGSPVIYVNGRKITDLSELKDIKSDDVKNVEVINNPGAKYDATVRSVIKITTKKPVGEGFSADISSYFRQSEKSRGNESVQMKYRSGKVDIFDNVSYSFGDVKYGSNNIQTVYGTEDWTQEILNSELLKSSTINNTLGLNVELAKNNFVGAKYSVGYDFTNNTSAELNSVIREAGKVSDRITTKMTSVDMSPANHRLNAYYAGTIKGWDINLDVDYVRSHYKNQSVYDENSEASNDRVVSPLSDTKNSVFGSRLVVEAPLWKGTLSFGTEYTSTDRNDNYIVSSNYMPESYSRIKESNVMPFVEYSKVTPIGMITLGIRNEDATFEYYQHGVKAEDKSRSYNQWFPNFSYGMQAGDFQAQLSFSGKTSRPSYRQLSNEMTYGNRFTWQTGNPLLKAEYVYDASLYVVWKWVTLYMDYQDTKNAIFYSAERFTYNSLPVTKIAFENIDHCRTLTSAFILTPVVGIWRPNLTLALTSQFYTQKMDEGTRSFKTPMPSVQWDNNFSFSKTFIGRMSFYYTGTGSYQNMDMYQHSVRLGVGVTKTFFNDKLSVLLDGNDLLKHRRDGSVMYLNGMEIDNYSIYDSRYVSMTVRYKFNQSKSKYKSQSNIDKELRRL